MKKQLFTDGVSYIDVDAVERLLQIEQDMERKRLRSRRARLLLIPAAALVVLLVCMTLVIIPFIPKNLDIAYEPSEGSPGNVWVYYVGENGKQQRELVKQPGGAQNMFASWQYLNSVDEQVQLLDYAVTTEPVDQTTVVPDTLWEFLMQQLGKREEQTIVTATLSAGITAYENQDALIRSLIQTIAKYAGVSPEQVRILIDGEQIGIAGSLQFYHSLQGGSAMIVAGSTLEITVGMTNVSDQNIEFTGSWSAFAPSAILTMGNTALITHEDFPMTEEYQKYVLAPGESREITYTFPIPEQAVRGEYDLLVTFGEQDFVFEKAVHVIGEYLAPTDVVAEFHEFLSIYGFVTVDVSEFRSAVAQLTYHSGKGMFDILTPAPIDYAEGYSGEEYGSDLFSYGYLTEPNGTSNNYFIGLALPDDMRLPCGISPDDRLIDSLYKMGVDADTAQDTVERAQKLFEGEQLALGGFFDFYITRNSYGEYVILYSFIAAPVAEGAGPPEYSLEIIYSETNMTFTCFRVKAGYEGYSSDAFTAPIQVTAFGVSNVDRELSQEETTLLLNILNCNNWQSGDVWQNSGLGIACDYQIISAGKRYLYDSRIGIFIGDNTYLTISEQDRVAVNAIFSVGYYTPNFQSITLDYTDYHVTLPVPIGQYVLHELNSCTWTHESLDSTEIMNFVCDGTTVGYVGKTFFTAGDYIMSDTLTWSVMNSLKSALTAMEDGTYDAILYYNGAFYGHNASVDEWAQGRVSFSMNICPEPLEELLFAYAVDDASSTFGVIVDCKSSDYLITSNGQCFARFTDAFPEFVPEFVCESLQLTFYKGNHCDIAIRGEDAQQISEILKSIDSFGDTIKPGFSCNVQFDYNGYPVYVDGNTGDLIIGSFVAMGDYDGMLLVEILARCYNQSNP